MDCRDAAPQPRAKRPDGCRSPIEGPREGSCEKLQPRDVVTGRPGAMKQSSGRSA